MTLADKLEQHFKAHPGVWFDGMALAKIAGCYAWRSRCSDLRQRGMTIENCQRRLLTGQIQSLYRFVGPQGEPQGAAQ